MDEFKLVRARGVTMYIETYRIDDPSHSCSKPHAHIVASEAAFSENRSCYNSQDAAFDCFAIQLRPSDGNAVAGEDGNPHVGACS